MRFDDTIPNIVTALQGGDLRGKQAGIKVWTANDADDFAYRPGTSKYLTEIDKNGWS